MGNQEAGKTSQNRLSDQIKFLMDHHPDEVDALLYGEITFTVRDGRLKICKVLHTIDVEKLQEGNNDGNAKDKQG